MKKHWLQLFAVFAALTLVSAACSSDDDDSDSGDEESQVPDDAIVIGALLPETGSLSPIIGALRTPIDMAVEEINDAGGLLDKEVVIAAADDGTDQSDIASAGFDRLVNSDGINVLLGPASSTLSENLMSDIKSNDIVACSGSNTAASLEDLDDGGHYFGFAPNDSLQGPALAELVNANGHSAVAIIARNDTYGTGFSEAVKTALSDAGVNVAFDQTYDPNATSFEAEAQAVAAAGPDAVVLIGFSDDGAKVMSSMIEAGIGPDTQPIYMGDGSKSSEFWESVNPDDPTAVEGTGGTAPAAAPEGVESPFTEAYAETGEDTIFSAYFYDCAIVTALAIQAAGSTNADDVSAAVFEVTSGGTTCQTFAECKELLDNGEDIDYEGASGALNLNDNGHVTKGAYDIWAYDAEGSDENTGEPQIVVGS